MRTLYLCGAINGCSDAEAKDWREETKRRLADKYVFLDPMRRDYRGVEDAAYREIVRGDLQDIDAADVILVAGSRPSWGTAMETFYAFGKNKYVVTICEAERVSPWLRFHTDDLVKSLDEAIERLRYLA